MTGEEERRVEGDPDKGGDGSSADQRAQKNASADQEDAELDPAVGPAEADPEPDESARPHS